MNWLKNILFVVLMAAVCFVALYGLNTVVEDLKYHTLVNNLEQVFGTVEEAGLCPMEGLGFYCERGES